MKQLNNDEISSGEGVDDYLGVDLGGLSNGVGILEDVEEKLLQKSWSSMGFWGDGGKSFLHQHYGTKNLIDLPRLKLVSITIAVINIASPNRTQSLFLR